VNVVSVSVLTDSKSPEQSMVVSGGSADRAADSANKVAVARRGTNLI
jgi:hypothetical protein